MVLFSNADVDQYIKLSIIKHKTAASHTWKAALNGGGGRHVGVGFRGADAFTAILEFVY